MKTLKQWMTKHNLTQAGLGMRLGVNQNTVSQWLSGERQPDYLNLAALLKLTGIDAGVMLKELAQARRELTKRRRRA